MILENGWLIIHPFETQWSKFSGSLLLHLQFQECIQNEIHLHTAEGVQTTCARHALDLEIYVGRAWNGRSLLLRSLNEPKGSRCLILGQHFQQTWLPPPSSFEQHPNLPWHREKPVFLGYRILFDHCSGWYFIDISNNTGRLNPG